MKIFRRVFILCLIVFALFTINSFAEAGDVIEFNGIVTTMPEVSFGISDLEDPKSPINSLKVHTLDLTQDEKSEQISTIISKYGTDKSVIGIDVSSHNGNIDWQKVAASGVKFAIIRVGGRGWATEGNLYNDVKFEENIKNAKANGILVGVYFYSTAITTEEALQEANLVVEKIKGYDIQYPVAYDFEEFYSSSHRTEGLSKEQLEANTKTFLDYVSSQGYKACIYSSANYLKNKWDMSKFSSYGTWVANWYVSKPDYFAKYDLWQYSDAGIVPGITDGSGYTDINVDYTYWNEIHKVDDTEVDETIDWSVNPPHIYTAAHIQDIGWKDYVSENKAIGTTGQSKRIEAYKMKIETGPVSGGIQYRSHVQYIGWESNWRNSDELSGTTGMSRRVEAIQIKLTGDISKYYDIYYRTHVQDYGWLGWAKNGEYAGTEGLSLRVESIEVKLVLKTDTSAIPKGAKYKYVIMPELKYRTHVQDFGWMNYVRTGISGTTGLSKRLEAITMYTGANTINGGIEYRAHVEYYGWSNDFIKNNFITGTIGESKRLEAMQIRLYGDLSSFFDVYYRMHVQDYGWLGWAKNGETSGTEGLAKRAEAIEIMLVPKNGAAPGDTSNSYIY